MKQSRLFLAIATADGAMTVDVDQNFEESIEKVFPIFNTTSSEEERARHLFTIDNARSMINPANVFRVDEILAEAD